MSDILKPSGKSEQADDYNERGISYFNLKRYPDAIKEFTKAIKLIENEPDFYFNRGLAYYSMKMLDQAIKDYRKSIELDPDHSDYYNAIGAAYEDSGQLEKSKEYLAQVQGNTEIKDFLAWFAHYIIDRTS